MSGEKEIEIRRLMQQFEHQISQMNSTAITDIAGDIKKSDFLKLARAIAILRARYLKQVLFMAHADESDLNEELCEMAQKKRHAYIEAIEGFDQLKHALQRGYFNLIDD
jgi:molybdenum cofactor biosynthesis enzyme